MNFVVLDTRYSGIYPKLPELGDLARTKRVTGLDTFSLIFAQSAFRDGPDLVGVRQSSHKNLGSCHKNLGSCQEKSSVARLLMKYTVRQPD